MCRPTKVHLLVRVDLLGGELAVSCFDNGGGVWLLGVGGLRTARRAAGEWAAGRGRGQRGGQQHAVCVVRTCVRVRAGCVREREREDVAPVVRGEKLS